MPRRTFAEPEAFTRVLDQILAAAVRAGLDESELARRAGAAPETLSRMKARGNGDFGLLARLARVAGLRLAAVPDDEALDALRRGEFF
jgi:DNA-binding phage protein